MHGSVGGGSLVIVGGGLVGGGLRLRVAVRGGLVRGGLGLGPAGGLVRAGLGLPLSRLVHVGLEIGLEVGVGSLVGDSGVGGLFGSGRSVVHSGLFFESAEGSFFFVEFRGVVGGDFFNDSGRIDVSLAVLVLVVVVVSSVGGVFESVDVSGSSDVGGGLVHGPFLL